MSTLSDATAYKKPVTSVGDEFIAWAQQYWRLEDAFNAINIKDPSEKNGEYCPYNVVKEAFIGKINEIINQRIQDYL